ncbi:hypothetical protein AAE250_03810 [Bacteroides sp. GD17]|jgi:hypothetical protein|uniref:hypothetical protein n=1 Tax=Bacteroides sp. GD17 TaxID=3139826 RepID=UPI0025D400A6|nr:hypothetical protein [uncultured Bacteroides sp.]
MKTLKKRIQQTGAGILFALSLTLMLATACTNELETSANTPSGNEGKKVTLRANLPQSGVQTRMDFTDNGTEGVKTTWSEGDAIMVYIVESGSQSSFQGYTFTLTQGAGTDDGTFEGRLPEGQAAGYMIAYPASRMPKIYDPNHSPLSILEQVQNGNGDMKHLSDNNFIAAQVLNLESKVTFGTYLTLLTFDLTLPTTYNIGTDGSPIRLDIKGNFGTGGFGGGASEAIGIVSLGLQNIDIQADRKLKAYMLTSNDMENGDKMQITLTTANGTIYSFTRNLIQDIYQKGKRYTATIGKDDWDKIDDKTFSNDMQPAQGFGTGSGDGDSEATPYLITNAAELKYFVEQVNKGTSAGGTDYSGKYIKLTTDIYVTADEWTPIGTSYYIPFKGNFDGARHTIYGKLHATTAEQSGEIHFGFFGYINDATVQNLNMNAEVTGGTTSGNYYCTGSIVGSGNGSNTEVKNCHNYGKVTGGKSVAQTSWTGGITGSCTAITDCSNHGEVTGGTGASSCDTGGIAGGSSSSKYIITNCVNDGKITAGISTDNYPNTGGIAGSSYNLSGCTNYGEVTSPNTENGFYLGGIIGNMSNNRTMHTCLNVGTIKKATTSSWANAGGLTGRNIGTIYSCNTHAGTVLEADGTPTPGNPAIGNNYGSTPDCEDQHQAP